MALNKMIFSTAIILSLFIVDSSACRGCIELDEITFDKLLNRFPVSIVKFDIAYPYGDKHEAYSQFAGDVAERVPDLLVAVVGVKDYGEKDNANLAKRFSVREIYPDIKLFINGKTEWIDYPAGKNTFHPFVFILSASLYP